MKRRRKRGAAHPLMNPLEFVSSPNDDEVDALSPLHTAEHPLTAKTVPFDENASWVSPQFDPASHYSYQTDRPRRGARGRAASTQGQGHSLRETGGLRRSKYKPLTFVQGNSSREEDETLYEIPVDQSGIEIARSVTRRQRVNLRRTTLCQLDETQKLPVKNRKSISANLAKVLRKFDDSDSEQEECPLRNKSLRIIEENFQCETDDVSKENYRNRVQSGPDVCSPLGINICDNPKSIDIEHNNANFQAGMSTPVTSSDQDGNTPSESNPSENRLFNKVFRDVGNTTPTTPRCSQNGVPLAADTPCEEYGLSHRERQLKHCRYGLRSTVRRSLVDHRS